MDVTDPSTSGFVEEGRKRKAIWIGGKWEDLVEFGMLDEEWLAGTKAEA